MKNSSGGAARFFTLALNIVILTVVSLNLTGASVWEGAAALAPRGDLPEDGYYAATNSFPPNTVVDITNLETGKSIRAIVASGLNTPGLLAVLSPDAAGRIGLGTRTIGRIRMTQPEDPIAFARFTEGLVASGDPDYDPAAMIAVDQKALERAAPENAVPERTETVAAIRSAPSPARQTAGTPEQERGGIPPSYDPPRTLRDPDYADYSQNSIVSVSGEPPSPAVSWGQAADEWEEDWDDLSYSVYPPGDGDSPEQTSYLVWEQGGSVGIPESPDPEPVEQADGEDAPVQAPVVVRTPALVQAPPEAAGAAADTAADTVADTAPVDAGTGDAGPAPGPRASADPWEEVWSESSPGRFVAEAQSAAKSSGGESSAGARILIQQPVQPPAQGGEYILVPAEERPPVRSPETAPVEPVPQAAARIDESLFIDSIEKLREDRARAAAGTDEERRSAEAAQAAEAARVAEEQRLAAEAARIAEEQRRAEEAARITEEQRRAAEAAGIAGGQAAAPEVVVILPGEPEEPRGPWAEPLAELPPPPEEPEILVRSPEAAGEPRGPWVEPIESARTAEVPPEPPLELTLVTPASPPPAPAPAGPFSVPVNLITEIEKGAYYVQLGAFRNIASVESALLKIDPGYPLNVQSSGSADEPVYRLLVGPVNLGESGALVQRFKGSGYRDAYIRSR
jgi:hypothetical protein